MEAKGVRVQCEQCTLSRVMRHEGDLPEGITKLVEGTPYCPNCDLPMRPVASVDITERPKANPGLGEGLSLAERLDAIRVARQDVEARRKEWDDAKAAAKKKQSAFDTAVVHLTEVIDSMTSFGRPVERPPLLEEMENPMCLCGHRKELHVDGAGNCQHTEEGDADPCICEIFEIAEAVPADAGVTAIEMAAAEHQEQLRHRLAQLQIVVDVADIAAWPLADYDAVVAYVTALETNPGVDTPERPSVLPSDVPDYIHALHRSLAQHGVVVGLGEICAWTTAQRNDASEWAAKEAEAPGSAERPEHLPAPAGEAPRQPRRRRQREVVGA